MQHHGLDCAALQLPEWECTLEIYRAKGFKLVDLAASCACLGIKLNHHESLSDALACAELFLKQ